MQNAFQNYENVLKYNIVELYRTIKNKDNLTGD